jgi:DNA-directed RNA polymerase subunit RPC12/RpoP
VKSSSLRIQYQCPQCGAPATLEETDHLFSCEFCRVKSYLLSSVYRYVLPHAAPPDKDLLYLPYWRCKGMLFFCASNQIKHRIVDVSNQGLSSRHFPASLGLRSQTLELRFLTPETEGHFLKPRHNREEMERIIDERFGSAMPTPIHDRSFIGEVYSIIFAPFYVDGKVFDAVLNRRPVLQEL